MNPFKMFAKTWLIAPGLIHVLQRFKDEINLARMSFADRAALKANLRLRDRHSGSRCFILGGGSSVKGQDVTKLAGEHVISVSNTFVHPDFPLVSPKYHVVPSLIEGHGTVHSEEKFRAWLKVMADATGCAEMFFHIGDRRLIEDTGFFKERTVHWIEYASWDGNIKTRVDLARVPCIWSVSELALTVAIYLGYEKIYLMGIDHDWFNGPLVYFYDPSKEHAMKPDAGSLSFADGEFQMRRHAEIFRKYKYLYSVRRNIFNANANPNHYLDVFPKVEYDALFIERIKREQAGAHEIS